MHINDKTHGFTVTRVRELSELNAEMIELTHDKTGLEAIWLKRDEENKTFGIAFETLPWNDTGVFHILEHSVLCGSDKYRVKEPFVELLKNSMNTFLNAMTYPDKTVYPVCSRNNKDFVNLMRVYLDAVFHPLIYSKPEIFHQEGWHYEFDENGTPSYKGVVFNEMKGAFASADELMDNAMNVALFPDSPYRYVSGGDPAKIPDLSYEEFISSHKKFYSPSNAYIFLDGSIDIDEILGIIEKEYLKDYSKTERIAPPAMQQPVKAEEVEVKYELGEDEDPKNRTRMAWGNVIGSFDDRERLVAMQVLAEVLAGTNQAYLNKAILSKGLAEDVVVQIYDGILQPWIRLEAKNLEADNKAEVEEVIFSELSRLADEGFDHEQLEAVMTNLEFQLRERDYGYAPTGLIFGLSTLDTWLYGGDPAATLEVGDLFTNLKKKMAEGYFENLVREVLIDNPHSCKVVLTPSREAGEERRKLEADRLSAESAEWSDSDRERLLAEQKTLEDWQHSADSEEDLKSIPSLELSDISTEPEIIPTEELEISGIKILKHEVSSNGIVYYNLYFDADGLSEEEIPQLSFLCELLGEMKTSEHSEKELVTLTHLLCGALKFTIAAYEKSNQTTDCKVKLVASFSALKSKCADALKFVVELLTKTLFESENVALDLLKQLKTRMFQSIVMSGHRAAMTRVAAQLSAAGVIGECASGFTWYKWLRNNEANWNWAELSGKLIALSKKIITKNGLTASFTGADDGIIADAAKYLAEKLPSTENSCHGVQAVSAWGKRLEGIVIPADICFAVVGENMIEHGSVYGGEMSLAARIISLAYLWNVIRVQGGAYGTGMTIRPNSGLFCYSFRDPNAARSLESYKGAADFVKEFAQSGTDLTGFIIGAISDASPLLTPKIKGATADGFYWREISNEDRRKIREEIMSSTPETLTRLSESIRETIENAGVCVIAARNKLEECGELDSIETL